MLSNLCAPWSKRRLRPEDFLGRGAGSGWHKVTDREYQDFKREKAQRQAEMEEEERWR